MSKLWIVGCSIADGVGVEPHQRWGHLLGQQLGRETVFLTAEGSSIEWAADQILRANIDSNDIVCWGLTTPNRSLYYDNTGSVKHILNVYYDSNPDFIIDQRHLVDANLAYKAVNYVRQVQNYLSRIGCEFAIGYTLPGITEHKQILINELMGTPGFFIAYNADRVKYVDVATFFKSTKPVNNLFDDLGTDDRHPGPLQHANYAEQFFKFINTK